MASLHLKNFNVQVFLPGSLYGPGPDVNASFQAFTEATAVLQAMERCGGSEADVVYVALRDGEKWWLYDVRIVRGQVVYRQAVPG